MTEKNQIRNLFGKEGDFNQGLANLFGDEYLDHPDDTQEGIPSEFVNAFDPLVVSNVTNLAKRAIEAAPEIDCQTHQQLLQSVLKGGPLSFSDFVSTQNHSRECFNRHCIRLSEIAVMDKYYSDKELLKMAQEEGLL